MGEFGEYVVVYDLLPEIAEKIDKVMTKAVNKAAFDIRAHAQAIIRANEDVDTGFMMNSVYNEVGDGENEHPYSDVMEPVKPGQELLPEVEKPKKHQALVAVGAAYGVFHEFGTVHMSPRPFLAPAVAIVAPAFLMALEKLEAEMEAL